MKGLEERSRAPRSVTCRTSDEVECLICTEKRRRSTWGLKKIRPVLMIKHWIGSPPAVATVGEVLKRHSFENAAPGTSLHLISTSAADNPLTLGQLAVDEKSKEITALPEVIERLNLEGHTVRLDAMGCQKNIARKLSMAHADYLLALKANHGALPKRAERAERAEGFLTSNPQLGLMMGGASAYG
jgi:hypothetical protein